MARVVATLLVLAALAALAAGAVMKHSFKAPFYLVRGNSIPFWRFTGNALVTEEYVRLTSDAKSQKGSIWNTLPASMSSWEVTLEFSITGGRQGADGLAFWYVQDPEREGPVYGSADKWHGLGVFIDTFDNNGRGAGPSVLAVLNDGTKEYDHASDGETLAAGRCTSALRNQPKHSQLRVSYDGVQIKVELDAGGVGWRPCFTAAMSLPPGYYFGVSAATGGLADAHDLFALSTTDLQRGPPAQPQAPPPPPPQQQQQVQQDAPAPAINVAAPTPQAPAPAPSYVTAAPLPPPPSPSLPPPPPPYVPPQYAPASAGRSAEDSQQLAMLASAVATLLQQIGEVRREVQDLRAQLGALPAQVAGESGRATDAAVERHANAASERYAGVLNTNLTPVKAAVAEVQAKARVCEELRPVVQDAQAQVRAAKTQVDTVVNEQRNLVTQLRTAKEEIVAAVASSGATGFWTYVVFLQFVFGMCFVWWRRTKDSHKYL